MLPINSIPRLTTTILVAAIAFTIITTAQTILPSAPSASFPACALSCVQLLQAQNICIPPATQVTDQATYNSCFCQSGLLAQLRLSPDGTCDAYCPVESDRQLLQSWYAGFCASGTASTAVASSFSTVTSGVSTVIVIIPPSSTSSASSPTSTDSGTSAGSTGNSNESWISSHWRWILMLGILLIGLGFIAFLAVCLKRRHRRKLDEKRAALSGFPAPPSSGRNRTPTPSLGPELWGPHQHMAHTQGWEYSHEQDDTLTPGGGVGREKKSKKIRREQSEKGVSRGVSRSRGNAQELDGGMPAAMSKVQRRKDREREREEARNRDQYAENRAQSMRGAQTAFVRDQDTQPRSQTMREKDRVAWHDPEKTDMIEKI